MARWLQRYGGKRPARMVLPWTHCHARGVCGHLAVQAVRQLRTCPASQEQAVVHEGLVGKQKGGWREIQTADDQMRSRLQVMSSSCAMTPLRLKHCQLRQPGSILRARRKASCSGRNGLAQASQSGRSWGRAACRSRLRIGTECLAPQVHTRQGRPSHRPGSRPARQHRGPQSWQPPTPRVPDHKARRRCTRSRGLGDAVMGWHPG